MTEVALAATWPHRERIRIRYQECDMQKVVFNAHYLAYCDETCAGWLNAAYGWNGADDHFDWMLVRATIEWQGSATYGDVLDVDCGIGRWGNTSFSIRFVGTVEGRPTFTAEIDYVCVRPGTKDKMRVPDDVRATLGLAPSAGG